MNLTSKLRKKVTKGRLIKVGLLLFLLLILLFPSASFTGASNGIILWWDTLLPTLLPFMILSNLIIKLRATRIISFVLYPILKHILPINKAGCYPVFIGFLAGMPVGAKVTADLRSQEMLSPKEAQLICAISNNASPMFILSFIAGIQLAAPKTGIALLIILYASSFLSALLWYHLLGKHSDTQKDEKLYVQAIATTKKKAVFEFEMLDDAILSAFEVVTKVGGYIILFSVLASLLKLLPLHSPLITALLSGVLEITTGIHNIAILDLSFNAKFILIAVCSAFGGFSVLAQTKSVLGDTDISMPVYCFIKLLSAVIAFLLSLCYVSLF